MKNNKLMLLLLIPIVLVPVFVITALLFQFKDKRSTNESETNSASEIVEQTENETATKKRTIDPEFQNLVDVINTELEELYKLKTVGLDTYNPVSGVIIKSGSYEIDLENEAAHSIYFFEEEDKNNEIMTEEYSFKNPEKYFLVDSEGKVNESEYCFGCIGDRTPGFSRIDEMISSTKFYLNTPITKTYSNYTYDYTDDTDSNGVRTIKINYKDSIQKTALLNKIITTVSADVGIPKDYNLKVVLDDTGIIEVVHPQLFFYEEDPTYNEYYITEKNVEYNIEAPM